jgi:hypothetical protein
MKSGHEQQGESPKTTRPVDSIQGGGGLDDALSNDD